MKTRLSSSWGNPYVDIGFQAKKKYLRLLIFFKFFLLTVFVVLAVFILSYVAYVVYSSNFEEYIFDDGTPVQCVLGDNMDRPLPSVLLINTNSN